MAKWRLEPSTGQLREVEEVAAGTGLNGGDFDWVNPPNYATPSVFDPSADIVFTGALGHMPSAPEKHFRLGGQFGFNGNINAGIVAGNIDVDMALVEPVAEGDTTPVDDLDTITIPAGSAANLIIFLRIKPGETITVKDGVGNIITDTGGDVVAGPETVLAFLFDAAGANAHLILGPIGGGGGGGSPHALLSATHPDTTPGAPAPGDVIGETGGAWAIIPAPATAAYAQPLVSPAGGPAAAVFAQLGVTDLATNHGAAGETTMPVGGVIVAAAAPGAGWSSSGPLSGPLNMMFPLPAGAWFEKV